MLETGRECICCSKKKFLKDYPMGDNICYSCKKEAEDEDRSKHFKLSMRLRSADPEVSVCECHRLFENKRTYKNGNEVIYGECEICRSEKKSRDAFGMQEHIERQPVLKSGGLESENIVKERKSGSGIINEKWSDITPTKSLEQRKKSEEPNTLNETKKNLMQENVNSEPITGRNTMQDSEQVTTETETTDLELYEQGELEEIPSTVTVNLSNRLREENSSSINLLNESATLLTTSAKNLMKDYTGNFGEGAVRKASFNEMEMALRLALGANEVMKTKLGYIKEGRDLINNMHTLLQDEDLEEEEYEEEYEEGEE